MEECGGKVEQCGWNSVGGTVWWNSFGGTVEQLCWNSVGGKVLGEN